MAAHRLELAGCASRRWVDRERRRGASLPSRRVTIRLDEDVLAVFKGEALAGGLPYQVAINQALRAYLRERELSNEKRSVEIVLAALEDETVREKLRGIL